jgi:hypothetical protein
MTTISHVRKEHVLGCAMRLHGVKFASRVGHGDAMATDEETLVRMARGLHRMNLAVARSRSAERINKPIKLDRVRLVTDVAQRLGSKPT